VKLRLIFTVALSVVLMSSVGFAQDRTQGLQFRIPSYTYTTPDVGDCGTFKVSIYGDMRIHDVLFFDKSSGEITRVVENIWLNSGKLFNASDPSKFVPLSGTWQGDYTIVNGLTVRVEQAGAAARAIVPGYGPVYFETGHNIYYPVLDWTNAIYIVLFNSGKNQYEDRDVSKVCDFLK
jgi:hypothetical protein